jgi:microcin C transport system permease protein
MNRLQYFLKRFLLVFPTFIGITLVVFTLIQFVPGGPVEQMINKMKGASSGEAGAGADVSKSISKEQRELIKKAFGFDKPIHERYFKWFVSDWVGMRAYSYRYPDQTAWQLIKSRLPVSLVFGLTGFFLTYIVCIPLGILKALKNNQAFDVVTSLIVFVGYAIPAFAFGMVLKMLLAGTTSWGLDILPHAGFVSDGFDDFTFWEQVKDVTTHMVMPVVCYMIGHFAVLTLLMKNSLLEEISKDYARTARAKGCSRRRTIWVHVLRNSLIPIATGFGSVLSIMFAGSVLIEQVFEIPGMGRLGLESVTQRDYMVFMGILSLTSILGLLGNMLSDFCYVLIDPRIDFSK